MKDISIWELQSNTIDRLRFPLIVMVVFIHNLGGGKIEPVNLCDIYSLTSIDYLNLLRMAFSNVIPRVAVPTFFLISGYLFFIRVDKWDKSEYLGKLKKRLKTLLIPYILWNLICLLSPLLFFYVSAWHRPENIIHAKEYIASVDWYRWIWDCNNYGHITWLGISHDFTYPINIPLWYIRDLMVLCLLTPFVFWIIKKVDIFFLVLIGILNVLEIWPNIHGFGPSSSLFFCLGAYFAIKKINMLITFRKIEIPSYCIAVLLLLILIPNNNYYMIGVVNLSFFYILFGVVCVFNIASRFSDSTANHLFRWLTNSTFFVYACHSTFLILYLSELVIPYKEGPPTLSEYILMPIVKIVICLLLYFVMWRFFPTILKVLTGNR